MPSYQNYRKSRFLKKEDIKSPVIGTIESVEEDNVAQEGQPKQIRLIANFKELDKGMVLNISNCEVVAKITGSDQTEDWPGAEVEIFHNPDIRYQGKRVGGLQLRQPNGHRPF